jgi:hypothetical protein
MAKHYIYRNSKSNKTIFETVQPNYISMDDVDIMVLKETGTDPRLNPAVIQRSIRVVSDGFLSKKKS